ncbi:MAG: XdhC family protein [Lachnospirales bacterium]
MSLKRELLEKILEFKENDIKYALVSITGVKGSSPSRVGQNMIVDENGNIFGTCGGGSIEHTLIQKSVECIATGKCLEFESSLQDVGMTCGGEVSAFIQVDEVRSHLVIVGSGHIGEMLYKSASLLNFNITIVDDRETYTKDKRFENARVVCCGFDEITQHVRIKDDTYVAIVTRGHETDTKAIKSVLPNKPKYVGLLGSRKKSIEVIANLKEYGFKDNDLINLYAPVGLKIATSDVGEIAFAIMAEILMIKNKGESKHLKI